MGDGVSTTCGEDALCEADGPDVMRSVIERIGDKWSLLLIRTLQDGPARFTELLRATPGISRRMLTLTLRNLERDGLITREAFAEIPPRVEYSMTQLGLTLNEPVRGLMQWAAANQIAVVANRAAYDDREVAGG
ncbi:winged helix-turn-helix transcriptional regulator [Leucobacter luti]|uniref:HxlR family transcriptional regulator n=1 Tax=Leucobacter luti TaxID=340320 RepID=A0A4Q7TIT4_9MICO|nr:helix-turn-helix domain-containing protein [Leucobacter luti]RZT60555.1 HxlR family transcriptional regulator [Leucobacter luti]